MCSSVSVHGGWNSDGSNWDAMNNLIGGKTPFERTLEPVYAIRPDVVIVNRFNYPVAWMEQPQEGLGLYHSGHFEPCEELGFEVYNHVQQQVYALKSLKGNAPAKPEVVSDASNRLLLALDGNPMEYRISESESFEGAEWLYYHISEGVDYSYLASLDQIWVQTRNSFGESEAVLVDVNGEFIVAYQLTATTHDTGMTQFSAKIIVTQIRVSIKMNDMNVRILVKNSFYCPKRYKMLTTNQKRYFFIVYDLFRF